MGSTVHRNKTNRISGVVSVILLAVIWFLMDPMYLLGSPADALPEDRFSALDAAVTTWGFGLGATVALAVFWYPSVEICEFGVTVRNPIRTVKIPLDAIDRVDDGGRYAKVYAEGAGYTCVGLETSLAMKVWTEGRNSTAQALDDLKERPRERPSTAHVVRSLRVPSSVELGLLIVWVVTGAVALLG